MDHSMQNAISAPRVMLAAPHSGSGKTAVTCGLLRLLSRKGYRLTSFKCGPDYIDPMFHRQVLGMHSINLDTFFTGEEMTRRLFVRHAKESDLSVIEGVMGYFDGLAGTELTASSYDLARVTETPVILIINAKGMSRSACAMISGFLNYEPEKRIRGVILNRISPMMYPMMKKMIEEELPVKVCGFVPVSTHVGWESRHLGLMQPEEIGSFQEEIDAFADELEKTLELDTILSIAKEAAPLPAEEEGAVRDAKPVPVRIGVARDAAFTFYYEDNMELLRSFGAELVPFSPLSDPALPEVDGLLLGGGYPELHMEELSKNASMRAAIREAAADGMPLLAECGGFMYLQETMADRDGKEYPMCGALPGTSKMTGRLVRFGYISLKNAGENAVSEEGGTSGEAGTSTGAGYLREGEVIRAHEFHYSDSTDNGRSCLAEKPVNGRTWTCMVQKKNLMAGYPHLYYASLPSFAERFVSRCAAYAAEKKARTASEG